MKKLLFALFLCMPIHASADYMDVIEFELLEGCSFDKYMEIVSDFNEWGKDYGYQTKIAMPLQSNNLTSFYWLGMTADAAAFGAAWDAWRDDLSDPDSEPAKLWARFLECERNISRTGYDVY